MTAAWTKIGIHGAAGRMGRRLIALAAASESLQVSAALDAADSPEIGKDAGAVAGVGPIGVSIESVSDRPLDLDVLIDFSVPAAAARIAETCAGQGIALVIATTGLDDAQRGVVEAAAARVPVVWSPNTSLAVNLTMKLCEIASKSLGELGAEADVEILEWHHRNKEDAPSGTALRFGEIVAGAMGRTHHTHGREGRPGVRPRDEIGYHAIRAGDHPGEHRILYGMPGECIELRVAATSRDSYAQGALAAARWILGNPPGVYGMNDVLGL